MIFEAIRAQLEAEGYKTPGRPHMDRYMLYRLITVLINHLADVLHRDPLRVFAAAQCRAERTAKGKPYCAYKQAHPEQEELLGEGGKGWREFSVLCPHCGKDLLDAPPVSKEEILREIHHKMGK